MNKKSNIIVGLAVVGVAAASIGWWAVSGSEKPASVSVRSASQTESPAAKVKERVEQGTSTVGVLGGAYVASKNGTKYFPEDCGSAKTIKEENKIYFGSPDEAEKAGYSLAKNCAQ